jgi:general stress protein 26
VLDRLLQTKQNSAVRHVRWRTDGCGRDRYPDLPVLDKHERSIMTTFTHDELHALRDRIKDVKFGMFTTRDDEGQLTSRPLTIQQVDDAGQLWFFVSTREGFTHELADQPSVNLAFADPGDHVYVSVSGQAELVHDRAKAEALWNPAVAAWFPQGLDDPDLALLKVEAHAAEYWDTANSKMVTLFALAKAAITGKPPTDIGEHRQLGH